MMRVSLVAAISIDGRIAERSDQLADWTSKEDKKFFVEKTKEAGVMIMGRKTFATIGKALPGRLTVIMTREPGQYTKIEGQLEATDKSPQEILADLTARGFNHVVVAGGGQIYTKFLQENLVTDLFITVEPIIFGSGVALAEGELMQRWNLESVRRLGEKSVLLHYVK